MALICVAPELRARGLMVSMAAFFPCKRGGTMVMDSLGIFIIGKAACIKLAYSPTVVGGKEPELQKQDMRKQTSLTDEGGRVVGRQPHPILTFPKLQGPGHSIGYYLPKEEKTKARWLQYSCTPIHEPHEPTFSAILEEKVNRPNPTCLEARITCISTAMIHFCGHHCQRCSRSRLTPRAKAGTTTIF